MCLILCFSKYHRQPCFKGISFDASLWKGNIYRCGRQNGPHAKTLPAHTYEYVSNLTWQQTLHPNFHYLGERKIKLLLTQHFQYSPSLTSSSLKNTSACASIVYYSLCISLLRVRFGDSVPIRVNKIFLFTSNKV